MAHFFLWELWKFHEQFLIQYRAWKMIIICHAIDSNWSVNCVFLNSKLLWMSSQIVKLIHLILGWNNAIIRNQSSELRIEFIDHIYSMSLSHFIVHCGKWFSDWEQKSNQHTNFQMKTYNKLRQTSNGIVFHWNVLWSGLI